MDDQIGKYELLKWASQPGQSMQTWSDVQHGIAWKLAALFPNSKTSAHDLMGLKALLHEEGLGDLLDFDAIAEGKGRATFNFLALLFVLESILLHKSAPIKFALPVDTKIQQFLQSAKSVELLTKYQSAQLDDDHLVQEDLQEQLARSLKNQDLEQFLSQIETACMEQTRSADSAKMDVKGDQSCKLLANEAAADQLQQKDQGSSAGSQFIVSSLLQEMGQLKSALQDQNQLIELYEKQNCQQQQNSLLWQAISKVYSAFDDLQTRVVKEVQTRAQLQTSRLLADAVAKTRALAAAHEQDKAAHYQVLCEYYSLQQISDSHKSQNIAEDLALQSGLASFQKVFKEMQQLWEREKETCATLQGETICALRQQLTTAQTELAGLRLFQTSLPQHVSGDLPAKADSMAQLCALQSVVIASQRGKLEKVHELEAQLRRVLGVARQLRIASDDIVLEENEYATKNDVFLQNAQIKYSTHFAQFLTNIGVNAEFVETAGGQQINELQRCAEELQNIYQQDTILDSDQLYIDNELLKQQNQALQEAIALILRKLNAFYNTLNEKYDKAASACKGLNAQLLSLPEKCAQKHLSTIQQLRQEMDLLADENAYFQQRISSQQKQIQEFIVQLEIAEQANFEAKRMYQRNKQLNAIIQLQADAIEQLLGGNKYNLQQKLDDIQAMKSQAQQIQSVERPGVKFENILLLERNRAEQERKQADQARSQVATLRAELAAARDLADTIKAECQNAVDAYLK